MKENALRPSTSKKKRKQTSSGEEDRLSSLPEECLHEILSFLDIREVMQTSFLSRKWRFLWKTLPVLNFDYSLWKPSSKTTVRPFVKKVYDRDECMGLVDRVLLLRDSSSNLTKLNLSYFYCCDSRRLHTWFLYALTQRLKELYIEIPHGSKPYVFPGVLFTSSEIEVFKLKSRRCKGGPDVSVQLPKSFCSAPRLRKLELDSVPLPKGDSNGELLLNYPLLEDLLLNNCNHKHLQLLHLSAPQLLKLRVYNTSSTARSCKTRMSTPNLRSLNFGGRLYKDYSLCNFSSVVRMKYSVDFSEWRDNTTLRAQCVQSLIQVLNGLYNIRTLEFLGLDERSPLSECMFYQLLNPLQTLKCLKLSLVTYENIRYVAELLKRAPCLENLTVEILMPNSREGDKDNIKDLPPQSMFSNHLRHVKILNAKCSMKEFMLVGHLLEYETVLQNITLCYTKSTTKEDLENFKERLHSLPRASQNVKLHFVARAYGSWIVDFVRSVSHN